MSLRSNQSGFSVVEVAIVVAVVAVLGFAGFSVYNRQHSKTANNSSQQSSPSSKTGDVSTAPDINSTGDLDKASATLDQNDPGSEDDNDSSQLDSQTANF